MNDAEKSKSCFVVTQIGEEDSLERIHADWVFDEILTPVFNERPVQYNLIRADKISAPGLIDAQIIDFIINSELVVADLTNTNPNVFYEIGIRHVIQKPIIHIHLKGQRIPFDVSLYRSMQFALTRPADIRRARVDLNALVEATEGAGFIVDNPVVRAKGKIKFDQTATEKEKILESQIEDLINRIENLEIDRGDNFGVKYSMSSKRNLTRWINIYIKANSSDGKFEFAHIVSTLAKNEIPSEDFVIQSNIYGGVTLGISSKILAFKINNIISDLVAAGYVVTSSP